MFKLFRRFKHLQRFIKLEVAARRISNSTAASFVKHQRNESLFWPKVQRFSTSVPHAEDNGSSSKGASDLDIQKITQGDPEKERKLKVLMLEMEVLRQDGALVPENEEMKDEYWTELLNLKSISARKKYLLFLFKKMRIKENEKKKRIQKRLEYEAKKSEMQGPESDHFEYSLKGNTIFLRIYDTTINNFYNSQLVKAMQFGQKLVIDCCYDVNMTKRENVNCAKQLMLLFADNRIHKDPFDLHFCNANSEGDLIKFLHKQIPTMYEPAFPLNLHDETYLDIFPKKNLVYLTPHCREEMLEYDHDAVYIVGALVDKMNNEPLSLAKAKKEGIKMQKFPLDRYLEWGSGSGKSLTINQCIAILNDIKISGDWNYALRHVPRRKIVNDQVGKTLEEVTQLRYDKAISRYNKMIHPEKKFSKLTYKGRSNAKYKDTNFKGRLDVKTFMD